MARMVQTTVGSGNSYHDVSCLWFPAAIAEWSQEVAEDLGFTVDRFIAGNVGPDALRTSFVDALSTPTPQPTTGGLIRWSMELSRQLDTFEARRKFATSFSNWIAAGEAQSLRAIRLHEDDDLRSFSKDELRRNAMTVFDTQQVVVERSPPSLESVMSLLTKGSGVAIGAYLGLRAGGDCALMVFAAVPGGMLLCGTAAGVGEALQLGLRERIIHWLTHTIRDKTEDGKAQLKQMNKLFEGQGEALDPGTSNQR